ncbi:MAG: cytochrome c [Ignavibacteriales bacterium]|nr:cytochrome c [Ignavibacteriales bacterium]
MEYLKTLALPQSLQHYKLVLFMMGVMTPMLVAYAAALVGTASLSLWYVRRGSSLQRKDLFVHANRLLEYSMPDKGTPVLLGIIPALAMVFLSAQVLQGTSSMGVTLWLCGAIAFTAGVGFLYAYRYAFRLGDILDSYESLISGSGQTTVAAADGAEYHRSLDESGRRYGKYGVWFVSAAMFLFASAIETTTNPAVSAEADSIFSVLISGSVWMQALLLFVITLGMTGTLILSKKEVLSAGSEGEGASSLSSMGYRLTVISLAALPALLLVKIYMLSPAALSGWIFVAAGAAILLTFVSAHAVYALQRDRGATYGLLAFVCFVAASSSVVIANQLAMTTATQDRAVALSVMHEKATEELRSKLGVILIKLTGDDIYNAKCSACHLFDQKKVGPPYLTVLPKYQGKKAQLISFILNPQKINPAYPSMPNQGLKPAEADSIASYILRRAGMKP